MRIWTIQIEETLEHLMSDGKLEAPLSYRPEGFEFAYDWMSRQMTERIGTAATPFTTPLWGWVQWDGEAKKKPDLRTVRSGPGRDWKYALLECEIPDDELLVSDFDAWHCVLNDAPVTNSDRESAEIQRQEEALSSAEYWSLVEKTWSRIFDPDSLSEDHWGAKQNRSLQASFWQLRMDHIQSFKAFKGVYYDPETDLDLHPELW